MTVYKKMIFFLKLIDKKITHSKSLC